MCVKTFRWSQTALRLSTYAVFATVLATVYAAPLLAQSVGGTDRPHESLSLNIVGTNRSGQAVSVTRLESTSRDGTVTRWSLGASNPTLRYNESDFSFLVTIARNRDALSAQNEMQTLRTSSFRLILMVNGARREVVVSGRGVKRTPRGIVLEDFVIS